MTNYLSNLLDIVGEYNPTTVKSTIVTLICIDLFGIYWYLGWKQLGIGILVMLMIGFTAVIIAERRNEKEVNKMDNEKKEKIRKLEKELKDLKGDDEHEEIEGEEKKEEKDDEMGFGLPDADEYNKRVEKALGSGF